MKLTYLPKPGVACPGDGWPAMDHDEADPKVAAKKIASGFYRNPTAKESKAAERDQDAAKKRVNQKYQDAVSEEIAGADHAIAEAQDAARLTRVRLGREE